MSANKIISSLGSWKSPITTDLIVQSAIRLLGLYSIKTPTSTQLYWLESRPKEQGRYVLVKYQATAAAQKEQDVNYDSSVNIRTTVHEYGGAPLVLVNKGKSKSNSSDVDVIEMYYSNFADQKLYRYQLPPNDDNSPTSPPPPVALTSVGYRYADAVYDEKRGLLYSVREDHTHLSASTTGGETTTSAQKTKEPVNTIVGIDTKTGEQFIVAQGADFYSSPRLSPSGDQLCYVQWNHPNMPWDNTELYTVDLNSEGRAIEETRTRVAGGVDSEEAVMNPVYSPVNGVLYFVTDRRNGWWNIHRQVMTPIDETATGRHERFTVECVMEIDAEVGGPMWTFGNQPFIFVNEDLLIVQYGQDLGKVGYYDLVKRELIPIETGFAHSGSDDFVVSHDGKTLFFLSGSPTKARSIVEFDLEAKRVTNIIKSSFSVDVDSEYFSVPETIEYPTSHGRKAYGYLYRPKNRDYQGPENEKPPLLVKIHGGPTSQASATLRLEIQYWTSRGFAILDVNYGGSTGYSREYRHRLYNGNWGVVDVEDCCNAAEYLVKMNEVDGSKLCIDGGSAGGYTTLACLVFKDTFSAGASYYGVSDLEALAHDTHKFEARYLDNLVGKYPQEKQRYFERSPIHFTDRLNKPIALFQGDQDKIVPPNQAEMFFNAVLKKNLPVTYLLFEGEQHGFRKAENIKKSLDGEFSFYAQVFGFDAPDIEPVSIHNLKK